MIISKYSMPFCLISEIIHPRYEIINIQRSEAEVNIILLRVNNFDIKQKRHGVFVLFRSYFLFYFGVFFFL